jgi:hypothetical protein
MYTALLLTYRVYMLACIASVTGLPRHTRVIITPLVNKKTIQTGINLCLVAAKA